MKKTIRLRNNVKIISFSVAIFLVLLGFVFSGYNIAKRYRQDLEYTYLRALNELSNYVSNLETTLNKGIYANTPVQQTGLSSKIMTQSLGAKMALEQLPVSFEELDNVNKFISHVGGYASSLSSKVARGEKISDEEIENLKSLGEYAKTVNSDIKDLISRFDTEKIEIGQAMQIYGNLSTETQDQKTPISSGFKDINDGFTDYPTLIYDGPFSDHITQMKSKYLKGLPEISQADAQNKAAQFLGVPTNQVSYLSESESNMPVYKFKAGEKEISVTKSGGYIDYIVYSRDIGKSTMDFSAASKKAVEFMAKNQINNMKESYYVIDNGVCTINYAFYKNNVIYYPDLIKVGVALDNGEIVSFDATGFLMNHTERNLPGNIISKEEAQKSLSKRLTVKDSNVVMIPTAGLDEKLCYEFECTGENSDRVLVYIDATSAMEEQIFIIISSDTGVLVM